MKIQIWSFQGYGFPIQHLRFAAWRPNWGCLPETGTSGKTVISNRYSNSKEHVPKSRVARAQGNIVSIGGALRSFDSEAMASVRIGSSEPCGKQPKGRRGVVGLGYCGCCKLRIGIPIGLALKTVVGYGTGTKATGTLA